MYIFHNYFRGGQPMTQVVNALELKSFTNIGIGGALEIRKLTENRRYEFWLTANTGSGEGEATSSVNQVTTMRGQFCSIIQYIFIFQKSVGQILYFIFF